MSSKRTKKQEPISNQALLDENRALLDKNHSLQAENHALKDEMQSLRTRLAEAEELPTYQANLLANISDVVYSTDDQLRLVSWNQAAEKVYGRKKEEVFGKNVIEVTGSTFTPEMRARLTVELQERGSVTVEIVHTTRSGEHLIFDSNTMVLRDAGGKVVGYVAVNRDITERKQAEEALRKSERSEHERAEELATVLDAAPMPVFIVHDPHGSHITGNRAADDLLRNPSGTEASLSAPAETRPRHFKAVKDGRELRTDELPSQRAARGFQVQDFEFSLVFDDGTKREVLGYGSPLWDEEGRPRGAVHILVDITERKRTEEKLRDHANLVENVSDAIISTDKELKIRSWNKAAERIYGWQADEVIGLKGSDVLQTTFPEGISREAIAKDIFEKGGWEGELIQRTKDGRDITVYAKSMALKDEAGVVIGGVSISSDITDRKRADEALRETREDLDHAQAVGNIGSWRLDVRKNELTWSDENHRIFGIPKGVPLTYETFLSTIHPDDSEYVDKEWKAGLAGEPYDIEHRIITDGKIKWVREKAYLEFDKAGTLLGGFGITQDITERKRAEEALHQAYESLQMQSEELQAQAEEIQIQYEELQAQTEELHEANEALSENEKALKQARDNLEEKVKERTAELEKAYKSLKKNEIRLNEAQKIAHLGNWDWNSKTDDLYWSDEMYRIFGHSPQEFGATYDAFLNYVHPEDRNYVNSAFKETLSGKPHDISYRIISANGEERIVHSMGKVTFDEKRTPVRVRGTLQDITERKRMVAVLESMARLPQENPDPVIRLSQGHIINYANPAAQVLLTDWGSAIGQEAPIIITEPAVASLGDGFRRKFEYNYADRAYLINLAPFPKAGYVNIYVRDITERKKAEEMLKESEGKLKALFNLLPVGVSITDKNRNILDVNLALEKILGLSRSDLLKGTHGTRKYIRSDGTEMPAEEFPSVRALKEEGSVQSSEMGIIKEDGSTIWTDVNAIALPFSDGQVVIATRDITESKKAEKKIKILANAVESSNDAIVTESLEGIITSWNKGAERIYGYLAEEVLGKDISILEPANLKGEVRQLIEKIKRGKKIQHYETLRLRKDGTIINVSVTLSPVFNEFGELVAISAIARDITERIKTEKALEKMEKIRIKEIHHRIKNNLQVISSLLDLEAEKFSDIKVLNAFKESQNRVVSMALIHEELYKGKESDNLDFAAYLQKLAANLLGSYNFKNDCISLKLDFEQVYLNMDTAIPLGIIVNELVSNSFKHAFPARSEGEIRINLCKTENSASVSNISSLGKDCMEERDFDYILKVSDNGKGIPEEIDFQNVDSLGLKLVNILAEQIDGCIELRRNHGTEFIIWFSNIEE